MSSQPPGVSSGTTNNGSSDLTFSSDSIERAGRPLTQEQLEKLQQVQSRSSDSQIGEANFHWPTGPLGQNGDNAAVDSPDETAGIDPRNDVEQSREAVTDDVEMRPADAHPNAESMAKEPQQSLFASPPATENDGSDLTATHHAPSQPSKLSRAWTSGNLQSTAGSRPGLKRASTTWNHRPTTPEGELGMSHIGFLPSALAQTVQIPLNLLRSLIPHPLLESPTPESLSASAMQVPVASLAALLEACQALDWISKRTLNVIGDATGESILKRRGWAGPGSPAHESGPNNRDFDLIEMMQKIADLVGGLAASKGIDLVIGLQPDAFVPADLSKLESMLECFVWSETEAIKFLLMSCISAVIQSAAPYSTLEIDLKVQLDKETVVKPGDEPDAPALLCTVGLTLTPPMSADIEDDQKDALKDEFISALIDTVGANVQTEFRSAIRTVSPGKVPPRTTTSLRHEITISSGQGSSPTAATDKQQDGCKINAPSTRDLIRFASSLAGQKIAFHGKHPNIFADQLTGLLTRLGCQVSNVSLNQQSVSSSLEGEDQSGNQVKTAVALTKGRPALVSYSSDLDHPQPAGRSSSASEPPSKPGTPIQHDTAVLDPVTGVPVTFVNRLSVGTPAFNGDAATGHASGAAASRSNGPPGVRVEPFNFVIIDDDIVTLQRELLRLRSAVPMLRSSLNASRQTKGAMPDGPAGRPSRPVLDHRTKSSPQIERVMAQHPETIPSLGSVAASMQDHSADVSQVIIFFTSLRSYRLVRDTVQPIIDSASFAGGAPPPEVMVLPKPAGLRRILTALYTAEHKPLVDAPFIPIATSPISPSFVRGKSWWDAENGGSGALMTLARQQSELGGSSTPWSPAPSRRSGDLDPAPFLDAPLEDALPSDDPTDGLALHATGRVNNQDTTLPSAEYVELKADNLPSGGHSAESGGAATRSTKTEADSRIASASTSASVPATHTSNQTARFPKNSNPHSPLPPDALEYFSETAAKMGGSAASGMVIQSPDGRPAGIFFQPKSSSSVSSYSATTPGSFRRTTSSAKLGTGQIGSGAATPVSAASDQSARRGSVHREGIPRSMSAGITGLVKPDADQDAKAEGLTGRPRAATQKSSRSSAMVDTAQSSSTRYPAGSIFAPQVGIQSVLSGSRPPVATPLSNSSSAAPGNPAIEPQWTPTLSKSALEADTSSKQLDAEASLQATEKQVKPPSRQSEVSTAAAPARRVSATSTKQKVAGTPTSGRTTAATGSAIPSPASAGTPPRKKVVKSSAAQTSSPASKPAQVTTPAKLSTKSDVKPSQGSAPSSPVVGLSTAGAGSRNVTNKLMARQTFAAAPSPSDTKKPSAQPQSGFMIGMGFAPTARRGTGPKKAPVREAVLPPIKVLIVEDNPINQRILSMFMSRQKIKYDVANNGREAVEKWQTGGFHLILMDIQLPVMDGIEATKEIRKLERSANIGILPNTPPATSVHSSSTASSTGSNSRKGGSVGLVPSSLNPSPFRAQVIIVALTASVLSSDRVEALAAGCNDFLNKPVSLPWLNQKILEWGSMMYLMYSGLSDEGSIAFNQKDAASKAQVHLGFGYGPAEKAKALASNLHIGAAGVGKQKKKLDAANNAAATTAAPAPASAANAVAATPALAASTVSNALKQGKGVDGAVAAGAQNGKQQEQQQHATPPAKESKQTNVDAAATGSGDNAQPPPSPPPPHKHPSQPTQSADDASNAPPSPETQ